MDGPDEDAASRRSLAALVGLEVDPADPADVFELQNAEGAGASGRVFRACRRADPSSVVALKVIPIPPLPSRTSPDAPPSDPHPPAAVAAVAREIAFLRACDHPNVVAFRGAYYKSGALWLAMEYCAGGSAASVRARGPLSERQIAVVLRGALRGLAYLHARRKLHRDVKGANILLTRAGRVKLADFGVSAQLPGADSSVVAAEDDGDEEERGRTPPFQRGTFVGTPYWMSPEMIQDGAYDHKADIWSLGVTAIELADREPPLVREHPMRALLQIPRNPPPTVRDPSMWSGSFLDFLRFVLRKNPRERPTAAECLRHAFLLRFEHEESVFAAQDALDERAERRGSHGDAGERREPVGREEQRVEKEIVDVTAGREAGDREEGVVGPVVDAKEASMASLTSCSSARDVGEHELLDLSVDEHNTETEAHALRRAAASASTAPGSPPAAMTLKPTRADSPVRRSKNSRSVLLSADGDHHHASSVLSELSMELREPIGATDDGVTAVSSSSLSSFSSSNPLAQIDASSVISTRVNALLASLSSSHVGSLLGGASVPESVENSTGSVGHQIHPPPAALLRRSSFGLSVSSSFREALTNSRANSTSAVAIEAPPPPPLTLCVHWRDLRPHQFGVSLDDQQTVGDSPVPALLHLLRRELLARDALRTTSWIYRASPNALELERARRAIDRGVTLGLDAVSDASVFANLLKLWLRELPVPLLLSMRSSDVKRLAQLVASGDAEGPPTRLPLAAVHEHVERSLERVRGRQRAVLEWLLDHLLEVLQFTSSNHMTAYALAVVIAPSVYPCGFGTHTQTGSDASMASVAEVVAMLRVLIHWRRAWHDTGIVDAINRLESVHFESESQAHREQRDREVKTERGSDTRASLVCPADGHFGSSKPGAAMTMEVDGSKSHRSVDAMVKECVSRAAGLTGRGTGDCPAGDAVGSLESFELYRRSVGEALASVAKTASETEFARRFELITCQHEPPAPSQTASSRLHPSSATWDQLRRDIPVAVKRLERWLAAAVSIEDFRAMVRSEREVFSKRRQLRELQTRTSIASPLSDRLQGAVVAHIQGLNRNLRDLRQRLANSRHLMGDAALRIAEMRGDNSREDDVAALTELGQSDPLVGLVLLGVLDQLATPTAV